MSTYDPRLKPMDLSVPPPAPAAEAARESQPATPARSQPAGQALPRTHAREGFWFSGGLGYGSLGCENCVGRLGGHSGGIGMGNVGFEGDTEVGVGAVFGVGWDLRVGRNVSLTPFYNGFAMASSEVDANVGQIGLAITIH